MAGVTGRAWLALALAVELAAWLLPAGPPEATFAWFRLTRHAGPAGIALAVAAGGLAWAAVPRLPRPGPPTGLLLLALAALAVHLPFLGTPQGQPDTANHFVLAQDFAADPLGTLLRWPAAVWGGPQGRFHLLMPLVPAVTGLAFRLLGESPATVDLVLTAWAVALPLAVAWAAREAGLGERATAAGWLALGTPFLLAESGWLLVDLPLVTLVAASWAAWLRFARRRRGLAPALALTAAALATKVSAGVFLAAPLLAVALRRRPAWLVAGGAAALAALLAVHPPYAFGRDRLLGGLGALALQLRPALWLLAAGALARRTPADGLALGSAAAAAVPVLYGPAEHVARYALPVIPGLALGAAPRAGRRGTAALVASGLVLALVAYRPVLRHNQAANLPAAVARLQDLGARRIAVWADVPATSFDAGPLAALVDFAATVPVCVGGTLARERPGRKRRWWEAWEVPERHRCDLGDPPPDTAILALAGAPRSRFEAAHPEATWIGTVSLYRSSHWLLPRAVALYRLEVDGRSDAGGKPDRPDREAAPPSR